MSALELFIKQELKLISANPKEYPKPYIDMVNKVAEEYAALKARAENAEAERDAATQEAETRRENLEIMIQRLLKTEAERDALKIRLDAALGLTKYAYLDHIGECNPKQTGTCTCGYWDARNREIEEATKFEALKAGAK